MSVLQLPSSVIPVCFLPSHLWTASGSPWSVLLGRSVCPAEPWLRKVGGTEGTKQNLNELKTEKANRETLFQMSQCGLLVFLQPCFCWFSGDFMVVLYEKSCILPPLCGLQGEKYTLGLNFTFTNECCNTHLCNEAAVPSTIRWTEILIPCLVSYSLWWTMFEDSGCTRLYSTSFHYTLLFFCQWGLESYIHLSFLERKMSKSVWGDSVPRIRCFIQTFMV